jgi:hypothetical protein
MSNYSEYFLNGPRQAIQLELFEIFHPAFTNLYRKVRNATAGVTVTLETAEVAHFDYFPLRIRPIASADDLDQVLKIDLGDLGEILPLELDAVEAANGMGVKPTVRYRVYRSDNLAAPLVGPVLLEVQTFSFTREGATFEAKAPSLNINRTGEIYRTDRFPMLRGLL